MTLSRAIGWSSMTLFAAAMVPALYLHGLAQGQLIAVMPGGPQVAVGALLGMILVSYRK
jgi:hypothetical protein